MPSALHNGHAAAKDTLPAVSREQLGPVLGPVARDSQQRRTTSPDPTVPDATAPNDSVPESASGSENTEPRAVLVDCSPAQACWCSAPEPSSAGPALGPTDPCPELGRDGRARHGTGHGAALCAALAQLREQSQAQCRRLDNLSGQVSSLIDALDAVRMEMCVRQGPSPRGGEEATEVVNPHRLAAATGGPGPSSHRRLGNAPDGRRWGGSWYRTLLLLGFGQVLLLGLVTLTLWMGHARATDAGTGAVAAPLSTTMAGSDPAVGEILDEPAGQPGLLDYHEGRRRVPGRQRQRAVGR